MRLVIILRRLGHRGVYALRMADHEVMTLLTIQKNPEIVPNLLVNFNFQKPELQECSSYMTHM